MPDSEVLASLANVLTTYPVDISTATTTTIFTPSAGVSWKLYGIFLESDGANTVKFVSGSTDISGAFDVANGTEIKVFNTIPVLSARAAGEALKITTSGAQNIKGWVQVAEDRSSA